MHYRVRRSPRQVDHARYADGGGSAAIASVVGTAAFASIRNCSFRYRRQAEDLALETAASLIALLACFLVFGRLRRRTRLNELMLAWALAVFALSNLMLVTVPIVAGWAPDDLTVWAAPAAGSLGAAAVRPRRIRARPSIAAGPGWCLPWVRSA